MLVVFVVSLISSLFLCSTSVHGLPSSSSSSKIFHYIHNSPSADLSSSLSLFKHRPVPNVDHNSNGDDFEMLIGDSNENDDLSSSSIDISNGPYEFDLEPSLSSSSSSSSSSLKFLPIKSFLLKIQNQEKRALSSPSKLNLNYNAVVNKLADASRANNIANLNQLNEPIRVSSSLKNLVETNPFARAWLTMLLQKLMQEQTMPYIFKYGRRRK